MPASLEEFLKKQYEERAAREEKTMRELLREYRLLDKALGKIYGTFAADLEKEKGEKRRVPVAWLHKNKRLKDLLSAVNSEIGKFGTQASSIIEQGQRDEIERQTAQAAKLLKVLGIRSPKIPPGGTASLPGRMGDGRKITDYFKKDLARFVTGRTRAAAVNSVTAEPGAASKKLKAAHGPLLGRTLTTARTETIRTARETALNTYRANPDELAGWTWHTHSSNTCDLCRGMNGTRHALGEDLVSHPNCRCMPVADTAAPRPAKPRLGTFTGTLKGSAVELKNVELRPIRFVKKTKEARDKLRGKFNASARPAFVKEISKNAENISVLRRAGVTDAEIDILKLGEVPDRFQVHHKVPLDGGGDNSHDNLVLIVNHPYHKAITNEQNRLTRKLKPGEALDLDWLIPPGVVYPETPE